MKHCRSNGLEPCKQACSCERSSLPLVPSRHLLEKMQVDRHSRRLFRSLLGLACLILLVTSLLLGSGSTFASTSPLLKVSQSRFNGNTDCSYRTGAGWTCEVTLSRGDRPHRNLSWSTRSSGIPGVTFRPAHGILPAGASVLVRISVPNTVCPASATFTFKGSRNAVSVPWSCQPSQPQRGLSLAKLTVTPTHLDPTSTSCSLRGSIHLCTVTVGETGTSQASVNWSASSRLSGVTFSPARGQLSKGASAKVTIASISCQNGSFAFSGAQGETPVKVPWSCTSNSANNSTNNSLSITNLSTGALALNGRDQTLSYRLTFTLNNATTLGWHVTIASTQFTTGSLHKHTLPATALSVTGVSAVCQSGSCNPVNNKTRYPVLVPGGNAAPHTVTFYDSAGNNTGTGSFTVTVSINVLVPGNAYAGTYSGTIAITLITGGS